MSAPWVAAGSLTADGKTLEYACFGPPPSQSPTLVLLHEGLGCVRLWRDFPAALSQATGCGVLAFSRAGYGQSDPVTLPRQLNYMTTEASVVLPEVLDALDIERAVLIGHSDGATITAIYAGAMDDSSLAGVVLIAPHFFTEKTGLAEIAKACVAYETEGLRERLGKYHRDPDNAFYGWNNAWLDPEFEAWNVAVVLDEISVPAFVIQGRDDPYGTLAQIESVVHRVRRAPVSTLILNECHHAPHLEKGPEVVAAIAAFCQQQLRSGLAVADKHC